jgi:type IV pilus assembly protein PilA
MLARIRKAMEEREGGFTLIELLVVIIIIGILAAIAIPVFLSQRQKGYDAQVKSALRNAATAEEAWLTDNNTYTDTIANLNSVGFKSNSTVTVTVLSDGGTTYCMSGSNSNHPNTFFWYDSGNGGLDNAPHAAAMTAADCSDTKVA